MATEETREDFRFDHRAYKSKHIDVQLLDDLMKDIVDAGTSKWSSIVAGVKIVVFFAYLWARKRLIDERFSIEKQEYEQSRANQNSSDISQDDLD